MDEQTIEYLKGICEFRYVMEGEHCVEISFYDDNSLFGGTIRKHSCKGEIIQMVSKMERLRHINIRKCKISKLPEMRSRHLEYVDISCNDIEDVPDWVVRQQSLKFLNIGANKIRHVPDMSKLPLEVLKLHKNSISTMPKVGTGIKTLNLYLNPMDGMPILDLPMLEILSFGVTKTTSLPSFSRWPNLRWLTLTVNQIEVLPDDICSLKKLEGLQLAKNRLKSVPDKIGDMNLKALTLYSNDICGLPDIFFNLKLNKLNLALNPLKEEDRIRVLDVFGNIDFIRI